MEVKILEIRNNKGFVKWLLIGVSIVFLIVMLVLPLVYVIYTALREGGKVFVSSVTDEYAVKSIFLTIKVTVITVIINSVFGIFAAWLITRFKFRGKKLISTLIDLPLTISPIIAGLIFVLTFGRQSAIYPFLEKWGIQIIFAVPGIVLATIFVTFPFISREIIPVLTVKGTDEEEAAALMGANGFQISTYQMGVFIWSCTLLGKSNGRIWSSFRIVRTFEGDYKYNAALHRTFVSGI